LYRIVIIPELHTTRTFEIPAWGCILLTLDNKEIRRFFTDEDVVFYSLKEELLTKLKYLIVDKKAADRIAMNGYKNTINGPYSHLSIMKEILQKIKIV